MLGWFTIDSLTLYWLEFIPTLIINQEGVDRSHSYIIYQTRMDSSKHGTNPTFCKHVKIHHAALGAQNVGLMTQAVDCAWFWQQKEYGHHQQTWCSDEATQTEI